MLNLTLEGRIVNGHPMIRRGVTDNNNNPVMDTTVMPAVQKTEIYFALAIPKNGAVDWKQTEWGQQINTQAVTDWPNGEHLSPTFSWKIIDGDSTVPNKKGNKPCSNANWVGHYIINCTQRFEVKCYHNGKYDPLQQIQDSNELKCGDHGRLNVTVKGNGPVCESPGIYINPAMFSFDRAGEIIINDSGPAAADVFGGGQAAAPATTTVIAPPITPATDLLQPGSAALAPPPIAPVEQSYKIADGSVHTETALRGAGYTDAHFAACEKV